MLRFCNGEIYSVRSDENLSENISLIFETYGLDSMIQVVDSNDKFVGIFTHQDIQAGEGKIDMSCVRTSPDILEQARKIFLNYKKKYLPVINKNGELECFCYDCNLPYSFWDYLVLLKEPRIARKVFADCKCVDIWGCNEWSYYLSKALQHAGMKYRCRGYAWSFCDIATENGDGTFAEENVFSLRCEGNQVDSIEELGFWENDFPLWEYSYIEDKFQEIIKNGTLFRNQESESEKVHRCIFNAILERRPFCVSRLGYTEAQNACVKELGFYDKGWLQWLYTTSGFFSKDGKMVLENVNTYLSRTVEAIRNADVNMLFDPLATAFLINKYANENIMNASLKEIAVLDSDSELLWTLALKDKKVLVISSFGETIRKQYAIKDKLHQRSILPDFELLTLQTHETQLGNTQGFEDWFAAYDDLLEKVKKIEFDVALISAGAYGYPLASDIKNMGKVAIELCSSLLPLFGIKIKRHDVHYDINKHWNSYWTYPLEEGPADKNVIEYACYWRG